MPPSTDFQRDFAAALLDPAIPAPRGLIGPDGAADALRFAVYRNNVVHSLVGALQSVVSRGLGVEGGAAVHGAFGAARGILLVALLYLYLKAGSFALPDSDWEDGYYAELSRRLPALRAKYAQPDARAVLDAEQEEIAVFRERAGSFGYVFYALRAPS